MLGSAPMRWGLGLLVLAWAIPANAQNVAVIESHVLTRPPEAARLMPPIVDQYASSGYLVGPDDLGAKLEDLWGKPGKEMTPTQLADVQALVEKGYRAW